MSYLEVNNNQDLLEVVKHIKAEKNLITCVSAYKDFLENFSCKPDRDKFPYPKVGSIIVENLNKYKNIISIHFRKQISKLLAKENHLTIAESKKIFDFAYNISYSNGIRPVIETYKNLTLMYKDLLDIHDNKKKPVIHTSKREADDIDLDR